MRDLIAKNHISCVVFNDMRDVIPHVRELNENKINRIFICSSDQNIVNNIYKQSLKYYDEVQIFTKYQKLEHKKLTICKSEIVKEMLIDSLYNQDEIIDFCDLLIICDMTINENDNIFIGKLWNKLLQSNRQILMPKLLLCISDPYIDIDFDLNFNSFNTIQLNKQPKNIEYIDGFKNDEERIELLVEMIKQRHEQSKRCIIFCKTPYECKYIKDLIEGSIFIDFEEFKPEENEIFITFQHYQFLENIDNVYDCILDSKVYLKQRSELADNTCFRFMTVKEFENINPISNFENKKLDLDILRCVDKNIIFQNYQEILDKLKDDDFVDNSNNLTEKGIFCKNFNISPEFSNLLLETENIDSDIFSCIVALSILNFSDSPLFLMPNENRKEHFDEFFNNDHTDTFLELYLSVWNIYFEDFGETKPSIYELMDWCKEMMLNLSTFQKILKCVDIIKNQYENITNKKVIETEINPKGICLDLEKIYKQSQNHKICKILSHDECIDHKFVKHKIDLSNHYNPYVIEPTYVIPLSKRNNKIVFYHPV